MLYLTTGIVFNEAGGALQEEQFILDQLSCSRIATIANITGKI